MWQLHAFVTKVVPILFASSSSSSSSKRSATPTTPLLTRRSSSTNLLEDLSCRNIISSSSINRCRSSTSLSSTTTTTTTRTLEEEDTTTWNNGQQQEQQQEVVPRWPPRNAQDLTNKFQNVYEILEDPGPIYYNLSETLRFSYVIPPPSSFTADEDENKGNSNPKTNKKKPIAIYLPGLDGYGISAYGHQFEDLSNAFDFWRLIVDTKDRTSFLDAVKSIADFVTSLNAERQNDVVDDGNGDEDDSYDDAGVVLIGESCGGVIAAAVALLLQQRQGGPNNRNESSTSNILRGLVLVNPATSFDETIWDRVVPIFSSLQYFDENTQSSNITSNNNNNNLQGVHNEPRPQQERLTPYSVFGSLLLASIIPDQGQFLRIVDTILNLPDVDVPVQSQEQIQDVTSAMKNAFMITERRLPPSALQHRVMNWLSTGTSIVNQRIQRLDNLPTLIVSGADDKLLPSTQEANRLQSLISNSEILNVRGRGHFVLDENVNLTEAILYSKIDPYNWNSTSSTTVNGKSNRINNRKRGTKSIKKKYDPVLDWEMPSKEVCDEVIEKNVNGLRTAVSPVFFSTDANTGKRWRGLSKVPRPSEPILFVGNHQFAALDLQILVAELIEQRSIFPRGLAHPVTFAFTKDNPPELGGRKPGLIDVDRNNPFNGNFQQFGAIEVSPRNYYKVLQSGQDALLFPGGAKEALTSRKDYPLFWPTKVDFVRTAARFNATIVPVSAVGMLDCVNVIAEPQEVARIPFLKDRLVAPSAANIPAARYDEKGSDEVIGFPLALPQLPARNYFIFGKPFSLRDLDPMDKETCSEVYQQIQSEVRRGLDDILRARQHDPFQDPVKRLAYERIYGKKAPTFPIDELN